MPAGELAAPLVALVGGEPPHAATRARYRSRVIAIHWS